MVFSSRFIRDHLRSSAVLLRKVSVSEFTQGNTVVVGLQWGDEGKGKIVDFLTEQADVVVRYCGGANAGHTVAFNNERYSTHLLPVGIFRAHTLNIIANGVVLDPEVLFKEIDDFTARGLAISPANLKISYKTHLVMPYHKQEDAARESSAEGGAIGTTRRGIGPTYADKMQRATAVRVADLMHEESLKQKIGRIVTEKNKVLKCLYDAPPLDWRAIFEQYRDFGRRLAPFVADTSQLLIESFRPGKRIVFEGAHPVLLDVDHGTYPYVTSRSCSAVDLCGITHVALTLIDVLSGLDHVQICTAYKHKGQRLDTFRADMDTLAEVEPIYETLPGWRGNISACRRFEELPKEAQQYVKRVEQLIGAPIKMVSVGPERTATIMR